MNLNLNRFTKSGALLSLLLSASLARGGGTIADIKITGNRKVEADAILNAIKVKKGDTWTESQIAEEIKTLFGLGYFSDLRISKEDTPAGQVIIISVIEKPSIVSIKYEGLKEFTEDEFKDKISTKPFTIVDEAKLTKYTAAIEKTYSDKGFYLASAKTELRKVG